MENTQLINELDENIQHFISECTTKFKDKTEKINRITFEMRDFKQDGLTHEEIRNRVVAAIN